MKKLVLLHGVSGSGKSTLAKGYDTHRYFSVLYASTDNYWLRPDGQYDWNPKLLGDAHKWNQKVVEKWMMQPNPTNIIFVDNTNLTFEEIKPYVRLAKLYNYQVEIIEPQTPWRYVPEELAKRNLHQVPLKSIERMLERKEPLEELQRKTKEFMDA